MGVFRFYNDPGLTDPVSTPLVFTMPVDHSSDPPDQVVYFGAPTQSPAIKAQEKNDPGVNQLQVTVADASPGSGHATTAVTLSGSSDFTGKVAGDPHLLGVEVLDGVAGARPVYVRFRDATGVQGNSVEISLEVLGVADFDQ